MGVYILTSAPISTLETQFPVVEQSISPDNYDYYITIGLFSGLTAAITESIMYLLVKDKYSLSIFQNLTLFYLFGGIVCMGLVLYSKFNTNKTNPSNISNISNMLGKDGKDTIDKTSFFNLFTHQHLDFKISREHLIKAIAFNGIIGFGGYFLLYYLVGKTSTILFNSLLFLGIIFSYMWGYLLSGESIMIENILGSSLIILAIFMLNS
jgi:drug/metabolite transporter (DMT)-like permease